MRPSPRRRPRKNEGGPKRRHEPTTELARHQTAKKLGNFTSALLGNFTSALTHRVANSKFLGFIKLLTQFFHYLRLFPSQLVNALNATSLAHDCSPSMKPCHRQALNTKHARFYDRGVMDKPHSHHTRRFCPTNSAQLHTDWRNAIVPRAG